MINIEKKTIIPKEIKWLNAIFTKILKHFHRNRKKIILCGNIVYSSWVSFNQLTDSKIVAWTHNKILFILLQEANEVIYGRIIFIVSNNMIYVIVCVCVCAMWVEVISMVQPQSTKNSKISNYTHKDFVWFIIYIKFNFSVYAVSHAWATTSTGVQSSLFFCAWGEVWGLRNGR